MVNLTKRQRQALREQRERDFKDVVSQAKPASLAAEFARLAEEANQDPKPKVSLFSSERSGFRFTPDHEVMGEQANDFLNSTGFFEYTSEFYPVHEDKVTSDGCFFDALMLNAANRIVDTSGFEEVSETYNIPEIPIPDRFSKHLMDIGEFDDGDIFAKYSDVHSITKAFLWCAAQSKSAADAQDAIARLWLPTVAEGGHTKHLLAVRMQRFIREYGGEIGVDDLERSIFSGLIPKGMDKIVDMLPDELREHVPQVFWTYKDAPHFCKFFGSEGFSSLLKRLGLTWHNPNPAHLCFNRSLRDLSSMAQKRWEGRGFSSLPADLAFSFKRAREGSYLQLTSVSGRDVIMPGMRGEIEDAWLADSLRLSCVVTGGPLTVFKGGNLDQRASFELLEVEPYVPGGEEDWMEV